MVGTAQSRPGAAPSYTPPRTPWGQPDISGIYTNRDETNTPLERPDEFKGRGAADFTAADLDRLSRERQATAAKIDDGSSGKPDEATQAKILWLDAYVANVDRSWRNPNLLVWHKQLWLIDH